MSRYSQRQRLLRDLKLIINRHCKLNQKAAKAAGATTHYLTDEAAADIIWADRWAVKRQRAWKPEVEIARIERIERGLDQVVREIYDLPEPLRLVLHFDADRRAAPDGSLAAVKAIRSGVLSARERAVGGTGSNIKNTGRTARVRACAVLQVCREIWARRTGDSPPHILHHKTPGPFGSFVQFVFKQLDINISVRRAADLLNKQRR